MLSLADAIVLPPGVRLEPGSLADDVRAVRFPVNETATLVVRRQGRPLRESALELSRRHALDQHRVADDVLRFAQALNAALLVNVRAGGTRAGRLGAWLSLALRLAPGGSLPAATARRYPLSTSSPARAAVGAVRALGRRSAGLAAAVALLVVPVDPGLAALALCVGVAVGLVVHEAAHVVALVGIDAALVTTGLRVFVIHRELAPRRRRVVAAAGPAAAALVGALAVTAGMLTTAPELALAGCPAAAHAIGLTAATSDGRAACGL